MKLAGYTQPFVQCFVWIAIWIIMVTSVLCVYVWTFRRRWFWRYWSIKKAILLFPMSLTTRMRRLWIVHACWGVIHVVFFHDWDRCRVKTWIYKARMIIMHACSLNAFKWRREIRKRSDLQYNLMQKFNAFKSHEDTGKLLKVTKNDNVSTLRNVIINSRSKTKKTA